MEETESIQAGLELVIREAICLSVGAPAGKGPLIDGIVAELDPKDEFDRVLVVIMAGLVLELSGRRQDGHCVASRPGADDSGPQVHVSDLDALYLTAGTAADFWLLLNGEPALMGVDSATTLVTLINHHGPKARVVSGKCVADHSRRETDETYRDLVSRLWPDPAQARGWASDLVLSLLMRIRVCESGPHEAIDMAFADDGSAPSERTGLLAVAFGAIVRLYRQ